MASEAPIEIDPYLESYADISIHRLMLDDKPRTLAYKNAIFGNASKLHGKTVLDVGCGTGILSVFCAQAGAKRVHAVECSSIAKLTKKVVEENNFEKVISVHECRVEDLELTEKVDVIVSEWMGFYLLHEGMLSSVLLARDKFLKPDGLMFPTNARIWMAACELPEFFDYWKDVYGVKMESVGSYDRESRREPAVSTVELEDLLTEPVELVQFDLKAIKIEELSVVEGSSLRPACRNGNFNGICLWFDVEFPSCEEEKFVLSTQPGDPATHWKQTVVILPGNNQEVSEKDPSTFFEVSLKLREGDGRKYDMEVGLVSEGEVEHEVPCECFAPKCAIIRNFLENRKDEGMDDDDVLEDEEPDN